MLDIVDGPAPDDNVGRALDNRRHQFWDVSCIILIVGIGVDNNVRAKPQTTIQAGDKTFGESLVFREPNNMIDAVFKSHPHRIISAPVIDDQPLHHIEPLYRSRQYGQGDGQGFLLIVAGDLDNQLFHLETLFSIAFKPRLRLNRPQKQKRDNQQQTGYYKRVVVAKHGFMNNH